MNDVLQLAGIAWPAVALQDLLRGFADQRHGQVQALAVDPQEVFGQRFDIPHPLAQGRQLQLALAQVAIQALVELARRHRLGQVDAGGRHQAHIHRAWLLRADPGHLVVLQGRQQLGLDRQRQVADLVQVQGPAISRAEPAGPAAGRAAEAARGITEQLGVGVGRADGPAVDRDEQPATIAGAVDMPGQQLLAGAGLATDQHRGRTRRQLLQLLAQLARTRIDEHQRLGADAQGAFLGIGKGQQRLAEGGMRTHGGLPPQGAWRRGRLNERRKLRHDAGRAVPCGFAGGRDRRSPVPSDGVRT